MDALRLSARVGPCGDRHPRNSWSASVGDPLRRPDRRGRHDRVPARAVWRAGAAGDLGLRATINAIGHLHPPRVQCLVHRQVEPDRRMAARARPKGACRMRRPRRRRHRHVLHRRLRARHDDQVECRRAGAVPAVIACCRDIEKGRRWNRRGAKRGRLRKKAVREGEPLDDRAPLQERPLTTP